MWRNSRNSYGLVSISLHWLVALAVIGLFALGVWMVELTYYDPWYKTGPDLHRSIGLTLFAVMLLRLAWRLLNTRPQAEGKPWEQKLAGIVHSLLFVLLFLVMISGYLISTADGRAIDVFGLFSVPALISGREQQEDIAGQAHQILAYGLIALVALHAMAALKHHFIDRDQTMKRMLKPNTH
jgi:cytochrome b561